MRYLVRGALVSAVALVCCFGMAGAAQAGTVHIGSDSSGYGPYQTGDGGEFSFTSSDLAGGIAPQATGVVASGYLFQSFCLEKDEVINPNTTYYYTIDSTAYYGGVNVSGLGDDPLDAKTAWLYTQFSQGRNDSTFAYAYSGTVNGHDRAYYADALQQAIWYLEGEITSVAAGSQADKYLQAANASGASDIGSVRVLNLWTSETVHSADTAAQSVLIFVPLPSAAAVGLVLMAGMGVVSLVRRRRSRNALA